MQDLFDQWRSPNAKGDYVGTEDRRDLLSYPSEEEEPFLQLQKEKEEKKWRLEHKKARIPRLHSEKYDWHVVRATKMAWRGFKKAVRGFFGLLKKILAPLFRTVIKDPPKEDEYWLRTPEVKEAVEANWNKKGKLEIPSKFPFIREDEEMQNSYAIGERVQKEGLEAVEEGIRNSAEVGTEEKVLLDLKVRPDYLKAQKSLFEARQKIIENREELSQIQEEVLQIFNDEERMRQSMDKIFLEYVEYFRDTEGSKEFRLKVASAEEILNDYVPGVSHIAIGPLELLAKDSEFQNRVIANRVLDDGNRAGQEIWQSLESHATRLREIYGQPAEEVVRWQRVIENYETNLKKLTMDDKARPTELKNRFDKLVS
ncbi:hypothetical protein CROQUDRAFT_39745 [Cronartium quercuum f. sp. fusiforme G11]|uniref:Uncharacterized protein n=1 Tax=Cronartium quercuum f. sp. fusiforme G11 TaxID=708437 RepID=A0A9P6NP34_9BASI|nr:hypothetical protein CROQUDRAFT_39745 [Cronartium quercuum f. sp. fusiforme G11]